MAESIPVEGGAAAKDGKLRKAWHIKIFVIDDLKSKTMDVKVVENIDKRSIIKSYNSISCTDFRTPVREHRL